MRMSLWRGRVSKNNRKTIYFIIMRISKIHLKNIGVIFLFCIIIFTSSCKEKSIIKTTKLSIKSIVSQSDSIKKEVIDSSFSAFLLHFQDIELPYKINNIDTDFSIELVGGGMIICDSVSPSSFIADYYVRNFLGRDTISPIEAYLFHYEEVIKDSNPWFYLKYGSKFFVNDSITAIIYPSYYQVSGTNGFTYFDMLATFSCTGRSIDLINIGEDVFYKTVKTNDDSITMLWEQKIAYIHSDYDIDAMFNIKCNYCKMTGTNREYWFSDDPKLLKKNDAPTFTKQRSKPVYMEQKYKVLGNGKIKKISKKGQKNFTNLF